MSKKQELHVQILESALERASKNLGYVQNAIDSYEQALVTEREHREEAQAHVTILTELLEQARNANG